MPSLDRIHRLLRLIELLQSGRVHNATQLAEQCGVSRRTIFRDLNTIQDSGIPVRYDEARQGYSLPTPRFLPPADFTLDEALALLVLCGELANGAQSIPFLRSARAAALKLMSSLPAHLQEYVGRLTESVAIRLDPHNPLAGSQQHFELLIRAQTERRPVRILYASLAEQKEISTLLNPYRVLFNRRSWYVIGRSSLHRAVRTFNIGRVRKAELIEGHYRIPPRFSLEHHLGDAWNLIREPGKRRDVVVRFQPKVATNVAEVQWHKTQRIVHHDDGTIDFHVTVDGLGEIVWWILGYGDQAEVLKPPELRDEIQRRIESMRRTYARPPRRSSKPQ
jgi:proteasome accessory factor B